MKKTWITGAAGTVLAAGIAFPAAAMAAPTATGLKRCYTAFPPHGVPGIPVGVTGGTPGDNFQIDATAPGKGAGSQGSVSGIFDASGNAAATLADVYPPGDPITPSPGRRVDLSLIDFGTSGTDTTTPLGSVLITNLALDLGFLGVGGNRPRTLSVSGTPFAGRKLYAFIVHNRRVVRRFSIGRGNVCGYARRRVTIVPPGTPTGRYTLYVNAGPKLDRKFALSETYRVERFF